MTAALMAATLTMPMLLHAEGDGTPKKKKQTVKKENEQIKTLEDRLKEQQAEIDALKAMVSGIPAPKPEVDPVATPIADKAAADAAAAAASASAASAKVDSLSSSVADLKSTTTGLSETVISSQKKLEDEIESPSALHYKGITIAPVAFAAFEGVYRQHSVNSDINTPLNNIPFPSANEGHTSELNFSGRQSRLGALFSGDAGNAKLSGYFEMDFLGTGTSSNNNQSNSYVLRQRQIWGQAALKSGFTVTGGQMWSLVTEDRKGTDPRTEILPNTIDPQYLAGYSWTRQPGIRVQQRFGDYKTGALTIAASAEQAQITNFTASNITATDFYFGGIGQNGGLYNAAGNIGSLNTAGTGGITTYANNVAPDVIVKAAFDYPNFHFEAGGIGRFLRNEYFPVISYTPTTGVVTGYSTTLSSHTSPAGGIFGAVRGYFGKYAEVAVEAMGGQGVGRYGSSQLSDATLRPDETLEPIRNYHGLFSLETHPSPKFDVYFYYGGEYAQRTIYVLPGTAIQTGYGPRTLSDAGCYNLPAANGNSSGTAGTISAASCASPTRYIQEAMGGITYKAINSPKFGRLQYQLTYTYVQRNLWSGVGSATTPSGPRATEPMVHVSMRYYIP
jgi:hypothetical protein